MKKVDNYRDHIMEELDGAMEYAENYVVYKNTHPQWAQMYHETGGFTSEQCIQFEGVLPDGELETQAEVANVESF